MAAARKSRPLRVLLRNLILTSLLAVAIFALFTDFNERYFNSRGFDHPEFLALEAGAVLLIAWLFAKSVTSASDAILERRGITSRSHAVRLFVNILVAIVAILILFGLAGVSAESIFLGSAFAGIVIGLAAQTVLGNVFAGVLIVLADPYRPGDRVTFVTSSYGALAPSYPHEMMYPGYSGTVRDVGLIYTVIELDAGGLAKFPNGIVLNALSLHQFPGSARAYRVRMTFPQSLSVAHVEEALAGLGTNVPGSAGGLPPAKLEVADISATTWDGVVVVWSTATDEGKIRDSVLRAILERLPEAQVAG